jgi:hypothetical protein
MVSLVLGVIAFWMLLNWLSKVETALTAPEVERMLQEKKQAAWDAVRERDEQEMAVKQGEKNLAQARKYAEESDMDPELKKIILEALNSSK